jgi:hypothetical protein
MDMHTQHWRGRVNSVTYGLELSRRVSDEVVDLRARELIRQRLFVEPVETYYDAISAALASSGRVDSIGADDDAVTRDFLVRLRNALDARRPWPPAPYLFVDPTRRREHADLRQIARLPLPEREVRARLNLFFDDYDSGGGGKRILLLELRTGEVVMLRSPGDRAVGDVELHAESADPAQTIVSFRELTGFTAAEVLPLDSTGRGGSADPT